MPLLALGADAMGDINVRMVGNVDFRLVPEALAVADLFTYEQTGNSPHSTFVSGAARLGNTDNIAVTNHYVRWALL